ncbi:M4 family metallopeptidase [Dyadobacter pollutisoli]|uniref:M4 family metallopeptidase n=1 Tax=Dyadobacter pollutisoli TaxID=2910158 RepID=A0A9E8SIT9_9BACT|nr:M4 family metallopeptidase [Dyadobacter pollutisoli]WAC10158.1 M4 family metallopeptidase [Dyadobacter pollutisoli]
MKRNLIIYLFYILFWNSGIILAQSKYNAPYKLQRDDSFNALFREMTDNGWLFFKDDQPAHMSPDAFIRQYAKNLGLSDGYHLKAVKEDTDTQEDIKIKTKHQLFRLYYKNVAVEGGEFSLHSVHDVLKVAHGRIVAGLEVDVSKPIDVKTALETAMSEQKLTSDDFDKKEAPEGELVLTRTDENFLKESYVLAYSFELKGEKIAEPYKVFVHAQTGKVLKKIPLFKNCFGSSAVQGEPVKLGSGTSYKLPKPGISSPLVASNLIPNYTRYLNGQGNLTFETEQVGAQFRLSAYNNQLNTRIDVNNTGQWSNNPDVFNLTNNWSNANRNATTAHWLTQKTHEMYQTLFLRNGYNGNGAYPRVLVQWAQVNAVWTGVDMIRFGRAPNNNSLVTVDVVGHEYTHAVNDYTANLTYERESGALDESIADIMGTTLEFYLLGPNANYEIAEDADQLRSMSNPFQAFHNWDTPFFTSQPQPDSYLGPGWMPTNDLNNDFGGVHTNSGVMNKWYWYMRTGGPTGTPLDYNKPARIVQRAQQYYLQPNSGYGDAVEATKQAAIDIYGSCSDVARQVSYAWTLVGGGIIQSTTSCPDCNFTIAPVATPSNTSCGAPVTLTANCVGSGCNHINTFQWTGTNVGQNGKTISINSPTTPGSYTYNVSTTKLGCFLNVQPVTVTTTQCNPLSGSCSPENVVGYGNASENNTYTVYVGSAGTYTVKINYARWEAASTVNGSVKVNGGSNQSLGFAYTGGSENYQDASFSASLLAGNNTFKIYGGAEGYFKTKKVCIEGTVSCPTPAPTLSANPSTINSGGSSTLTASNCGGTVTWSHGLGTGGAKTVSPTTPTTYTATCTANGCTSNSASVTVNVNGPVSGACSSENIAGYGNSSENYTYTVNANPAGTYTVKINYARWEAASTVNGSIKVNGGSDQSLGFAYTGGSENYQDVSFTASLVQGNNTFKIYGGPEGYFKTKKVCITTPGGRIGYEDMASINESEDMTLTVSPNPNSGEFDVSFYLGKGKKATLSAFDIQGKSVYEHTIMGNGKHSEKVVLPVNLSGTFIVSLNKGEGIENKKTIIIK